MNVILHFEVNVSAFCAINRFMRFLPPLVILTARNLFLPANSYISFANPVASFFPAMSTSRFFAKSEDDSPPKIKLESEHEPLLATPQPQPLIESVKRELEADSVDNNNSTTTSMLSSSKKPKLVTEHSYSAIVGPGAHTLILGTFPSEESQATEDIRFEKKRKSKKSKKSDETILLHVSKECYLRGSTSCMNYGNWKNPFWNIAGTALNFTRELTTYDEKKSILINKGYALWDVCGTVEKKSNR